MNKSIDVFFLVLSSILNISCKENKSFSIENEKNNKQFFGNSILKTKKIFGIITEDDSYKILNTYNKTYKKYYYQNYEQTLLTKINFIIAIKNQSVHENKTKINLYTFSGNKKIDSIPFYRNIANSGRGEYNCLTYFDQKTNEIWQIRYFYLNGSKSVDIVLYEKSSILHDGKIQSDSLIYLDESLDAEMEKLHLYY